MLSYLFDDSNIIFLSRFLYYGDISIKRNVHARCSINFQTCSPIGRINYALTSSFS